MKEWTADETFILISEYETNKCLWDKSHPLYKNLDKRADAYKQIATKFSNCNEIEVKDKMRSLRTIFMERLRIIKKLKRNGRSVQPKWQFFSALEFLRRTSTSVPTDSIDVERAVNTVSSALAESAIESAFHEVTPSNSKKKKKIIDDDSAKLRTERYNMVKDTDREQRHEKFGSFVATMMDSMQDPELEKLTELKIRMLLGEMCQEAAKRQLMAYEASVPSVLTNSSVYSCPEEYEREQIANRSPSPETLSLNTDIDIKYE